MSFKSTDVVLLTDSSVPALDPDDQILRRELERRGIAVDVRVWDDPSFDPASAHVAIVRSTFDYIRRRDEFLAFADRVARSCSLHNPPDLLRWNSHKGYLADLARKKVAVVPTVHLERGPGRDLRALARARHWKAVVVKPAVSAAGRDTVLAQVGNPEEMDAAQAVLDALLAQRDALVQEFLPSVRDEGELSLVYFGRVFSHAVRRLPLPNDFRARHRQGAPVRATRPSTGALLFAHHVLEATGAPPLYARVDLLRDAAGSYRLGELEVIEPHLFFRHAPHAVVLFADAIQGVLDRSEDGAEVNDAAR